MVELRPASRAELLQITGVGEKKADQFGAQFLALIQQTDDALPRSQEDTSSKDRNIDDD
jgi:endonuclease III